MIRCGKHGWKHPVNSPCPECSYEMDPDAGEKSNSYPLRLAMHLITAWPLQIQIVKAIARVMDVAYALETAREWQP